MTDAERRRSDGRMNRTFRDRRENECIMRAYTPGPARGPLAHFLPDFPRPVAMTDPAFTAFLDRLQGRARRRGPDLRREIALTRGAIAVTVLATLASIVVILRPLLSGAAAGSPAALVERLLFLLIVLFLIYGGWVYQLTRLAYLRRMLAHRRVPDRKLLRVY